MQACEISFSKIGCFADKRRPFPKLLMTQRKSIDWKNWNEFLERQVLIDVLEQLKATCSLTLITLSIMVRVVAYNTVPEIFRLKGDLTAWVWEGLEWGLKTQSVCYQFFTIVLIRFQSFALAFNLVVFYPTVTSEDVCWGIGNVKSLIKVLQHALFCHVCDRSLCIISVEAEMAEE